MDHFDDNEESEENENKTDGSDDENLTVEPYDIDEDFADLPEDIISCLLLNQAYQQDIKYFLAFITNKLCANKMMQEEIRKEIGENSNSVKPPVTGNTHPHSTLAFLSPYFKDVKGLHPPANSDVIQKKVNGEINQAYIAPNKQWTKNEKSSLVDSVLRQSKKNYLAPLFKQKEQKLNELRNMESPEFARVRKTCEREIEELTEEIKSIDKRPLESFLLPRESSDEIDWLTISTTLNKSDFQCEIMWSNCLHPSINTDYWTKEEDEKLSKLFEEYGNDWDTIAKHLKTNRLPWQCLSRYQSELNPQIKRVGPLSKAEAKHVEAVIEQCRIGDYIPWQQVNYFIEGRSLTQIKHYWQKINLPKRGEIFTELEDKVLIAAVDKYGIHNWRKVAHFLPGRSNRQCRERYVLRLGVENRIVGNYTPAEDKKILQLAKEHNCKWVEIEKKMVGRNAKQISTRYEFLLKYHNLEDDDVLVNKKETETLQTPTRRVILNRRHCKRIREAMNTLYGIQSSEKESEDTDTILREGCRQLREQFDVTMRRKRFSNDSRGRPKKTDDETEVDNEISELFSYYSLYRRRNYSKACQISVQEQYVTDEIKKCLSSLINVKTPENNHLLSTVVNRVVESNVTDFSDKRCLKYPPVIPPNRATVRGFQGLLLQQSRLMKQIESEGAENCDNSSLLESSNFQRLLQTFISFFMWPSLLSIEYAPQKPTTLSESRNSNNERSNLYIIRDMQHFLVQSAINNAQLTTVEPQMLNQQLNSDTATVTSNDSTIADESYGRGKRRKTESWKKLDAKKPKETVD
ncbi:snRNA-activating protein complex subunit 4-like protein [Leptotrombidium deliense]|uniref:snRNA-activating protein complex subunit 4-like protein n=1 Tax=Leptotrombidium deliense TaxID=299467 RepID=A0A443SHW9_9ACAR|nr:snRNA-activating protein complex subunit 4-like protein [Leptotrombidium deliense]